MEFDNGEAEHAHFVICLECMKRLYYAKSVRTRFPMSISNVQRKPSRVFVFILAV